MGYLGGDPPPQKEVIERKEKFVLNMNLKTAVQNAAPARRQTIQASGAITGCGLGMSFSI
jgi:hypothetical protein